MFNGDGCWEGQTRSRQAGGLMTSVSRSPRLFLAQLKEYKKNLIDQQKKTDHERLKYWNSGVTRLPSDRQTDR